MIYGLLFELGRMFAHALPAIVIIGIALVSVLFDEFTRRRRAK